MNDRSIQFRHSITYGAIFGGVIVFILFTVFFFGMLNNSKLTSWALPIYVIGAYIAVRHFRDRVNGGFITFGRAFGTSLIVCVTMGAIWALYRYLLFKYLSPELMIKEIEEYQENMLNIGWSEKFVELSTSTMSPFTLAFGYITNSFFYGSLLSLVIAVLLKRNINPLLVEDDQNN